MTEDTLRKTCYLHIYLDSQGELQVDERVYLMKWDPNSTNAKLIQVNLAVPEAWFHSEVPVFNLTLPSECLSRPVPEEAISSELESVDFVDEE